MKKMSMKILKINYKAEKQLQPEIVFLNVQLPSNFPKDTFEIYTTMSFSGKEGAFNC